MEKQPITEHLTELRARIIKSLVAVLIFSSLIFFKAKYLFEFFKRPVLEYYPNIKLITLSPTEPLYILVEISIVVGAILASPFILYQIWKFIEPGLYENEKKLALPIILFASILFVLGASFAYFAVLPFSLRFLIGIGFSELRATPYLSVSLYINFLLKMMFAFGVAFEMPIFLYILQRSHILTQAQLKAFRKYFIVFAFAIGAFIAPDVSTQVLMALPLIILYEISIFLGKFVPKTKALVKDENN